MAILPKFQIFFNSKNENLVEIFEILPKTMTNFFCVFSEMIRDTSLQLLTMLFFLLAIERFIETQRKTFLQISKNRRNFQILIFFVIFFSFIIIGFNSQILFNKSEILKEISYCLVILYSQLNIEVGFVAGLLIMELINFSIFYCVWKKSKSDLSDFANNQAQLPLARRIQLRRSINLTKAMRPGFFLHVGIYVFINFISVFALLMIFGLFQNELDLATFFIFAVYIPITGHTAIFPVLLLWRHETLKETLKKIFLKIRGKKFSSVDQNLQTTTINEVNEVAGPTQVRANEQEFRFQHLDQLWGRIEKKKY